MTSNDSATALHDALLILGAAGVVIPAFARVRITPVIGFIVIGILTGPYGLARFADQLPWLQTFSIADRDDVVLIGLDTRDIGTLAPELETSDDAHVYSERKPSSPLAGGTGGGWLMHATAPVRNAQGNPVGSVRMTVYSNWPDASHAVRSYTRGSSG